MFLNQFSITVNWAVLYLEDEQGKSNLESKFGQNVGIKTRYHNAHRTLMFTHLIYFLKDTI